MKQVKFRIHQQGTTSGIQIQINDHAKLAMVYHPNNRAFAVFLSSIGVMSSAHWNEYEYYVGGKTIVKRSYQA